MLALWLFSRYLNHLDDYKYTSLWEKRIQGKGRYYFFGLFIYYIIAVGIISQILLYGSSTIFFDIILTMFVMFIYGYYFIRNIVRFIALENNRYMQIKMGHQTESFSKSNVVN